MNTFCKDERLSNRNIISKLFSEGKIISITDFKLFYSVSISSNQDNCLPQILISVPKHRIKKATDRNTIRRRIREAYRTNKNQLIDNLKKKNCNCNFALVYNSNEILSFQEIEKKIILILQRLLEQYEKYIR